jgi:hypothetical protein
MFLSKHPIKHPIDGVSKKREFLWGLLQIYKLRDDYRKVEGTDFTPLEFHDEFVKQGSIPIRAVRRILRGNNEPTI